MTIQTTNDKDDQNKPRRQSALLSAKSESQKEITKVPHREVGDGGKDSRRSSQNKKSPQNLTVEMKEEEKKEGANGESARKRSLLLKEEEDKRRKDKEEKEKADKDKADKDKADKDKADKEKEIITKQQDSDLKLLPDTKHDEDRFTLSERIAVNSPIDRVWTVIRDWDLNYLKRFSSEVKVVVGEKDGHRTRTVNIPHLDGAVEETLLVCNDTKYEVSYVMNSAPLPYKEHTVHIQLESTSPNECVVVWNSSAIPTNKTKEDAKAVAQEGLEGAIVRMKQAVQQL